MPFDDPNHYDWGTLIGTSPVEEKVRLIVEDKTREVNELYREWKEKGDGVIMSIMLRHFEKDDALEREYQRWLDALDIHHLYKDDQTLLQFINHKRWQTEKFILPNT